MNNHKKKRCLPINGTQTVIYETGAIKFKNFNNQIPIPFKIYADTECLVKRTNISLGKHTKLYQEHIPNSIGAKLVCIVERFTLPTKIFTGNNYVNDFIKWIFIQQKRINQIIDDHFNKKLKMSEEDENYKNSDICWIYNQKIIKNKVRDHCHITVKFRGPAHKECNSKLGIPRKLPIIFHNLEDYDGHIIFKDLNNFDNIDIQAIPRSSEKYMGIIINRNIIFLDSLQFYKLL